MTKEEIITELKTRFEIAKTDLRETEDDVRTPAFNQNLGYHDALGEFLEWIEENDTELGESK